MSGHYAVIAVMIEKASAVENLEAVLSVKGLDMVQFGPADYSMSIGLPGQFKHPKVKEAAVVGFPHSQWVERPVGFVVARPEDRETLSKEELLEFLDAWIANSQSASSTVAARISR